MVHRWSCPRPRSFPFLFMAIRSPSNERSPVESREKIRFATHSRDTWTTDGKDSSDSERRWCRKRMNIYEYQDWERQKCSGRWRFRERKKETDKRRRRERDRGRYILYTSLSLSVSLFVAHQTDRWCAAACATTMADRKKSTKKSMTKMTTTTTTTMTTKTRKKTWPLEPMSATLNVGAALGVAALTHRLTELEVGDTVGTEDRGYGRQEPKEQAELSRCCCARALAHRLTVQSIFSYWNVRWISDPLLFFGQPLVLLPFFL